MINFFKSVLDELRRLQTPSRKETYITVITILVSISVAALAIMFADFIISKIVKIIFRLGI
jgi:preprotein translocase SecE subunit